MKTHLKKIGASLLGAIILTSALSYAGSYGGYIYAPGGAKMGFGTHLGDSQINAHTIRVYCLGSTGDCWMISGGTLYTGPDILPSYTPDSGGTVTLPETDITDI